MRRMCAVWRVQVVDTRGRCAFEGAEAAADGMCQCVCGVFVAAGSGALGGAARACQL